MILFGKLITILIVITSRLKRVKFFIVGCASELLRVPLFVYTF